MDNYDFRNNGEHIPEEEDRDFLAEKAKKQAKKSRTPMLDNFGKDLTAKAVEGGLDPVVGREKEIEQLIEILNKYKKNNPVLVGEPGVGKTAIVEGFAQRVAEGVDIDSSFHGCRVIELNLTTLVAGTKYRGEFEARMESIIKEASENKNIILFVDELHTVIGAGNASGSMDASNMLKPALARGEMRVIGATTFNEYQKYIEKDKAFERRFQKITVDFPTKEEAIEILTNIKEVYQEHHGVEYTDDIIDKIYDLSERYVPMRNNPDKSIDLMDEVGSKIKIKNTPKKPDSLVELQKEYDEADKKMKEYSAQMEYAEADAAKEEKKAALDKLEKAEEKWKEDLKKMSHEVTLEDIAHVISAHTGIPVQSMTEDELDRLAKMAETLKHKLINQDDAVEKVADAVQRSRTGVRDPKRPIASFLFLGPTGVGKTEMVKQLAKFMFDSEENIVRLDMSEYSMKHEASKLIGSPPGFVGHDEGGQLTEKVKNKPYSIVLLDELEKAHPDVKNNLLQILDEGTLTDSQGRTVDFRNTIVIMTSNIGTSKIIQDRIPGFGTSEPTNADIEGQVISELKKHRMTTPEFLNRIDDIIIFKPLERDSVLQILDIQLGVFSERILIEKGIKVKVSKAAKEFIANKGYDKAYGARPLKRSVMNHVENVISKAIINKEITEGDSVTIDLKDGKTFIK